MRRTALIVLGVVLLIGLILLFKFKKDKSEQAAALVEIIPQCDIYGSVHISEFLSILQSRKALELKNDRSDLDLLSLFRDPFSTGIDLFTDPAFFLEEQTFSLLFRLTDGSKFADWVENTLGEQIAMVRGSETETSWMSSDEKIKIQALDGLCRISLKNDSNVTHLPFDFEKSDLLRRDLSGKGLIKLKLESESLYSILDTGVYTLYVNDLSVKLLSGNEKKQETRLNSLLIDGEIHPKLINEASPYLEKFYPELKQHSEILYGKWHIALIGTKTIRKEIISYDYDENFNKVELKEVVENTVPKLSCSFTNRDEAVRQLDSLLQPSISSDGLAMGSYRFPYKFKEDKISIGTSEINTLSNESISLNIQYDSLRTILIESSVDLPEDAFPEDFYSLQVQKSERSFNCDFELNSNSKRHVLAVLADYFLSRSAATSPSS